jgi:hypothetical protein
VKELPISVTDAGANVGQDVPLALLPGDRLSVLAAPVPRSPFSASILSAGVVAAAYGCLRCIPVAPIPTGPLAHAVHVETVCLPLRVGCDRSRRKWQRQEYRR